MDNILAIFDAGFVCGFLTGLFFAALCVVARMKQ